MKKGSSVPKHHTTGEGIAAILRRLQQAPPIDQNTLLKTIVSEAAQLTDARRCELYVLDNTGEQIELRATNDAFLERVAAKPYARGDGLTGWVFRTGKPLMIPNILEFFKGKSHKKTLSDRDLCSFSDCGGVSSSDAEITWLDQDEQYNHEPLKSFMGVPVKSEENEVIGVLRIASETETSVTKMQLEKVLALTAVVSLILHNERERRLKDMLIKLGSVYEQKLLFQAIVDDAPQIIFGRGCSIFLINEKTNLLELSYTSSNDLKPYCRNEAKPGQEIISYRIGNGKTGMVASLGRTMIINYYRRSRLGKESVRLDLRRYRRDQEYGRAEALYDLDQKTILGIVRLHRSPDDSPFTEEETKRFRDFVRQHGAGFNDIAHRSSDSNGVKRVCETGDKEALSFLAAPIKDSRDKVVGVLRLPRTFDGSIFTDEDVAFVESIIDRLAMVLERDRILRANLRQLSEIASNINSTLTWKTISDNILEAATEALGFEFATLQLVRKDKHGNDIIEKVKGLKHPTMPGAINPTWKSSHPLSPPRGQNRDVQAWVLLEHKEPIVLRPNDSQFDKYFDKSIYDKYGHRELIRAFVPIIAFRGTKKAVPIGTIEAGHNLNNKNDIGENELQMLQALADQAAITIINSRQREEMKRLKRIELQQCKTALSILDDKGYLTINSERLREQFLTREFLGVNPGTFEKWNDIKQYIRLTERASERYIRKITDSHAEEQQKVCLALHDMVQKSSRMDTLLFLSQKRYRDHYKHQFLVGALGAFLLDVVVDAEQSETLRQRIARISGLTDRDVDRSWWIAALLHDHGYPISYILQSSIEIKKLGQVLSNDVTTADEVRNLYMSRSEVFSQALLDSFNSGDPRTASTFFDMCLNAVLPPPLRNNLVNLNGLNVYDHGLVGALNLINLVADTIGIPGTINPKTVSFINSNPWFLQSLVAIACHNHEGFALDTKGYNQYPIAFLLRLCDELQEWDRHTFFKQNIDSDVLIETDHIKIGRLTYDTTRNHYVLDDQSGYLNVMFEYRNPDILERTGWNLSIFENSKKSNLRALGLPNSLLNGLTFEVSKLNRVISS